MILTALVAVALGGALHGVGAAHSSVLLIVSVPALLGGVWVLGAAAQTRIWLTSPAMVLVALAAYCAIQALPIPSALLARIAPHNIDVWHQSVRPWSGATPSAVSISLDPGASSLEALKWTVYAAVFIVTSRIAMVRRSGATIVTVVFVLALSAAVSLMLHGVLGAEALYGVYRPSFNPSRWQFGPLLNSNTLAGYLNLGVFCGLGLVRRQRTSTAASWLLALGTAVVGACVVFTGSRGGVGALVVGAVLSLTLELLDRRQRSSSRGSRPQWLPVIGVLAGMACLVILGAHAGVGRALAEESLLKLRLIPRVGALVADYPWLGVGRGAFESAFAAYAHHSTNERFQFAENFLAQWTAEWGIPAAALALAGLWRSLWRSIVAALRRSTLRGALIGVMALLLQNLVDLGLELPAVAMAAAALLGSIWGTCQSRDGEHHWWSASRVPLRAGMLRWTAAFVLVATCWNHARMRGSPSLRDDQAKTYESITGSVSDLRINATTLKEDLVRRVARHPAEPLFFLGGGYLAWRTGENPLPWIGRAIELSGGSGRSHLLLAMVLADRGIAAQALLSLKLAVRAEPGLASTVAPLAIRHASSWDALMSIVPAGAPGADLLVEMARAATRAEQHELRTRLLRAALSRTPSHEGAVLTRANDILGGLGWGSGERPKQGECALSPSACMAELGRLAKVFTPVGPMSYARLNVVAGWLVLDSRAQEADRYLGEKCPMSESPSECWRLRVLVALRYASAETLRERLETYVAASCDSPANCAGAARFAAGLLSAQGAHTLALSYRLKAATEQPTGQTWADAARTAIQAGRAQIARSALMRAQELGAPKSEALWRQLLQLEGAQSPLVHGQSAEPSH